MSSEGEMKMSVKFMIWQTIRQLFSYYLLEHSRFHVATVSVISFLETCVLQ